jgi:zinc transport system substrate-binding protein
MRKFIAFCGMLGLLTGCVPVQKNEKAVITVSILPHKYFVERIASDNFEINVITPPGISPETYEPTPKQMRTLAGSVLYFANGYLMFEDLLAQKTKKEVTGKTVDLSRGIDFIAGDIVDHGDHVHLFGIDPHYWLSPNEAKIQARNMLDAILAVDPENSNFYEMNFEDFMNDIDALDTYITKLLSETKTRTFLIYHPAFAYLARQYELEQVALEMDGKEPTVTHIKNIVDLARREGINTVLVQSQFNRASAEAVAKEIGGTVEFLDPLPENWLENMYAIAHTLQKVLK